MSEHIAYQLMIGPLLGLGAIVATGLAILVWTAEDFHEQGEDDE